MNKVFFYFEFTGKIPLLEKQRKNWWFVSGQRAASADGRPIFNKIKPGNFKEICPCAKYIANVYPDVPSEFKTRQEISVGKKRAYSKHITYRLDSESLSETLKNQIYDKCFNCGRCNC